MPKNLQRPGQVVQFRFEPLRECVAHTLVGIEQFLQHELRVGEGRWSGLDLLGDGV